MKPRRGVQPARGDNQNYGRPAQTRRHSQGGYLQGYYESVGADAAAYRRRRLDCKRSAWSLSNIATHADTPEPYSPCFGGARMTPMALGVAAMLRITDHIVGLRTTYRQAEAPTQRWANCFSTRTRRSRAHDHGRAVRARGGRPCIGRCPNAIVELTLDHSWARTPGPRVKRCLRWRNARWSDSPDGGRRGPGDEQRRRGLPARARAALRRADVMSRFLCSSWRRARA